MGLRACMSCLPGIPSLKPGADTIDERQMELQVKGICDGLKQRHEVVHECLERYREVYIRTSQHIDVLKAVCVHGHLFLRNGRGKGSNAKHQNTGNRVVENIYSTIHPLPLPPNEHFLDTHLPKTVDEGAIVGNGALNGVFNEHWRLGIHVLSTILNKLGHREESKAQDEHDYLSCCSLNAKPRELCRILTRYGIVS